METVADSVCSREVSAPTRVFALVDESLYFVRIEREFGCRLIEIIRG
jgi:hypothetical protein